MLAFLALWFEKWIWLATPKQWKLMDLLSSDVEPQHFPAGITTHSSLVHSLPAVVAIQCSCNYDDRHRALHSDLADQHLQLFGTWTTFQTQFGKTGFKLEFLDMVLMQTACSPQKTDLAMFATIGVSEPGSLSYFLCFSLSYFWVNCAWWLENLLWKSWGYGKLRKYVMDGHSIIGWSGCQLYNRHKASWNAPSWSMKSSSMCRVPGGGAFLTTKCHYTQ